jgi:hypothetical protein
MRSWATAMRTILLLPSTIPAREARGEENEGESVTPGIVIRLQSLVMVESFLTFLDERTRWQFLRRVKQNTEPARGLSVEPGPGQGSPLH